MLYSWVLNSIITTDLTHFDKITYFILKVGDDLREGNNATPRIMSLWVQRVLFPNKYYLMPRFRRVCRIPHIFATVQDAIATYFWFCDCTEKSEITFS